MGEENEFKEMDFYQLSQGFDERLGDLICTMGLLSVVASNGESMEELCRVENLWRLFDNTCIELKEIQEFQDSMYKRLSAYERIAKESDPEKVHEALKTCMNGYKKLETLVEEDEEAPGTAASLPEDGPGA